MPDQMKRIVLASRPDGKPTTDNFRLETAAMPEPDDGEMLVEVGHISLDPYMRGRMDAGESYVEPVPIDGVIGAAGVGRVLKSRNEKFSEGDEVTGAFGWASHACAKADSLRKIDTEKLSSTAYLGVLGMPGFTGWFGLTEYGRPQENETLVVAAATGPVGSMVGQIARARGLRTIGIAGGPDKCALATDHFGFDACIDHRAHNDAESLREALKKVCPDGIDVYFENVGGKVLHAVIPLMNQHGRIPVCGMVAWYNAGNNTGSEHDALPWVWRTVLVKFLSVNGFIISNHRDRYDDFLKEIAPKVAKGEIETKEDVTKGLENAPQAFIDMLEGGNFGKQVVRIA